MRALVIALSLAAATAAAAHESHMGMVYSPLCCQGTSGPNGTGDCAPIPATAVKAVQGGFQIILNPGDHPLVTKPHQYFVPYGKEKHSTDGAWHACLWPSEDRMQCFYAPDQGA